MAGTKLGGQKAAAKNLAADPDFYKRIGAKGGQNGSTGGFGQGDIGRVRAIEAGRKGGYISRRGSKQNG